MFIVDDLDGFEDEALIKAALPREAQAILYSTRDPSLIESLDRDSQSYYIPTMKDDEMASLMIATMRRSEGVFSSVAIYISEAELEAIAKVVAGHALGACRAISYVLHVLAQTTDISPASVFLDMFNGPEWESRLQFLTYKPRIGLSIMETFVISLERIREHGTEAARLLELLAFLSDKDQSLNFRIFLHHKRPWLEELQPILPDYDVFASRLADQREYLSELENVSIGVRPDVLVPLQIHPLWLECIQQRAGHEGRVRWIRQIILLCRGSYVRGEEESFVRLLPFLKNAFAIAARFRIHSDEFLETRELKNWIGTLNVESENLVNEPGSESQSDDETDIAEPTENTPSAAVDVTDTLGETPQFLQDMLSLRDSCNEAAQALASSNIPKMSEQSMASWRQRYIALLQRLQSLEKDKGQDSRAAVTLHLEVYDLLLGMVPAFERYNPALDYQLRRRKEELQG